MAGVSREVAMDSETGKDCGADLGGGAVSNLGYFK